MNVYPWQQSQWQRVAQAIAADRLSHGLLLHGPAGIGLTRFSRVLAARLLCVRPDAEPACGACKACTLLDNGNHPDLELIEPEEAGKQIKVEQIRDLIDFMHLKSQYGKYKIAVIEPAEAMNNSSANTLLKTLEEPPATSLLILNSHDPQRLPVTVRSRCQSIEFSLAGDTTAAAWLGEQINDSGMDPEQLLQLAGAPLAALDMVEGKQIEQRQQLVDDLAHLGRSDTDPIAVAGRWAKLETAVTVRWLQRLFMDMLRLKLSEQPPGFGSSDVIGRLRPLVNGLDLREIVSCCQLLARINAQLNSTVTYNKQTLLEEFVFLWREVATSGGVIQ